MNLVFIYGPPASGKYTIGKIVSTITWYPFFHNHLTFDMAAAIFEKWSDAFNNYCKFTRLEAIKMSIEMDFDLIFTIAYSHEDLEFVREVEKIAASHKASIKYVKLTAPIEELKKRLASVSRKMFDKVQTEGDFEDFCKRYDPFHAIPDTEVLEIATDKISVEDAADQIINHYNLPKHEEEEFDMNVRIFGSWRSYMWAAIAIAAAIALMIFSK